MRSKTVDGTTTVKAIQDPVLIALLPRWSDATEVVWRLAFDHAVALAENDAEARSYREQWTGMDDRPLLILRCAPATAVSLGVEVVLEIASRHPGRPIGVLLVDGPEASGYREGRRKEWNHSFGNALVQRLHDIQVFEYALSWATRPPRVR
ncbi:MAG: hypothetical protein KIS66_07025 [Fimbriimonadaceae bacterium]|nr:hypothetical protein [Fimbriimonadaceae bacterium]